MASNLVSELKESAGLPVGPAVPSEGKANTIRALRPQDSLVPLREVFSRAAHRDQFLQLLTDYVRLLLGAEAVVLHEKRDNEFRLVGFAGVGMEDPKARQVWIPQDEILKTAFTEGKGTQTHLIVGGRQHSQLMVPFPVPGGVPICFTAYLPPERVAFSDPCFSMLHLTTQFLVQRELLAEAHENEEAFVQATMLVEMFTRTSEGDTFKRSLFTLVTELEKFFGCQRVAIGTGSSRSCKVHAVSGMSSEEKRTLGYSQLGAVMREAIALDEMMVWPSQHDMIREVVVAANHDDLLHSFKSGKVLVAPIRHEQSGLVAAVALLYPPNSPDISQKTYRLLKACQPHLGSLVGFLKQSKPGAFWGSVLRFWRGGVAKRVLVIAALVLFIATMIFPITYRVGAECVLQPVMRRTVAAPFENRLYRTFAKPGDEVRADQILAELDGREIRVSLAEAIAAKSAAVKKRDNAMVLEDPATLQMAQLEADRLALEVERLQFRSDNLLIRSPIDGIVLTGNLERSEGVPVTTGQKLFEVAPLETMLMEIAIPETEVRHVTLSSKVEMRLDSDSSRVWESDLVRVYPISEIQNGQNVFIGEAMLQNENDDLRPGMKGSVRIHSTRKPIGWILFHRLWEFLRLKLW